MRDDRVWFRCSSCNVQVVTSRWSAAAKAVRCGRCYRIENERLYRLAKEADEQRRAGMEQQTLPDW